MKTRCSEIKNIGFISTRFAGTDGVSLETEKWADIFEEKGLSCFYFAGKLDRDPERSLLFREAYFKNPQVREIFRYCFSARVRDRNWTKAIHKIKVRLKDNIYEFLDKFKIDILIPENCLTIPLHIPLGLAVTEVIAETGINTIAHHHDFYWERQQFLTNVVWEYLSMAFPPQIPFIRHVVINSTAGNQLSLRTGISSTVIPNVMDFENPPPPVDDYSSDVRAALGVDGDEFLILQPTRVVKRKGIEHAIEFVSKLGVKAKLVISHASGDEGHEYEQRVMQYSKMLGVNTIFVSDIISDRRGFTRDGRKIYHLNDIYPHADFVTYPSNVEGFGNAFLEAIYFRKPILVNRYSIYDIDIKPKGFKAVEINGYVSEEAVAQAKELLNNPKMLEEMVEHNYQVATDYYSYSVLRRNLENLMICEV